MLLSGFTLLALLFMTKACQKDKFEHPVVHTGEVVEITEEGVVFHGKIIEQGSSEIIDHGFVWSTEKFPSLSNGYIKSLGPFQEENFQAEITSGLEAGKDYYLKAFARIENLTIYGRETFFSSLGSLAPTITGIEPLVASWGDTLQIFGKNFSLKPGENNVKLGTTPCPVISESDTLIRIIIPDNLLVTKVAVSVSFLGNTAIGAQQFNLSPPEVYDFSPKQGTHNTSISIWGKYFRPNATQVFIGNKTAQISFLTDTLIQAITPQGLGVGAHQIKVMVIDQMTSASQSFDFVAPRVDEIKPDTGTWLNRITIKGNYFSTIPSGNLVKFQGVEAPVSDASNDSLVVKVPLGLVEQTSLVTVTVAGETSQEVVFFNLLSPIIDSLQPTNGTFRNIIEIYGKHFNPVPENNKVFFNNAEATVISSSFSKIRVKVPDNLTDYQNDIKVKIGDMEAVSEQAFILDLHTIDSFSPTTGVLGNNIEISGSGFNPVKENNTVRINNKVAEVISASATSIRVRIPENCTHGENSISVTILGRTVWAQEPFMLYQPWTRLNDPPFGPRSEMIVFSINERIFVGGGQTPQAWVFDFWEYIPASDTWTQKTPIPNFYSDATTFSTNLKGYIITQNEVLAYDPDLDQWTTAGSYPISSYGHSAFFVKGKAYITGGSRYSGTPLWLNSTYRFNEGSNTWTLMANYPSNTTIQGIGFAIDSKGYVGLGKEDQVEVPRLFSYDPSTNLWQEEVNLTGIVSSFKRCRASSFVLNGKAYFGTGDHCFFFPEIHFNDFYEFTPETSTIRYLGNLPGPQRSFAYSFSHGGFGFLGGGRFVPDMIDWYDNIDYFGDFYKFDPSKLPPVNQ